VNRRVVLIVLVGVVVAGGAFALLTLTTSNPVPEKAGETVVATPLDTPAEPADVPSPEPSPPEPIAEPEPSRRAATPRPEPAPPPIPAPDPELVTLHVDSDVPDSQVFVDRTFVGTTPLTTTAFKVGSYRLNVEAPGYDGVARDLTLTPGSQDVVVKLREVRLDAALNVIHKHRMGSCSGRLVATPQGMRYETTNKNDGFDVGLFDLDTFEVDYLDKNLRIGLARGKRYDFTDPDGNADRLFVFHRDVEKARERLRDGDPPAVQ
jgi:hypothetical protein